MERVGREAEPNGHTYLGMGREIGTRQGKSEEILKAKGAFQGGIGRLLEVKRRKTILL